MTQPEVVWLSSKSMTHPPKDKSKFAQSCDILNLTLNNIERAWILRKTKVGQSVSFLDLYKSELTQHCQEKQAFDANTLWVSKHIHGT